MTRKEQVAAEIERRIAERDRLWAHIKGPQPPSGLDVIDHSITSAEQRRLARRIEILEEGLARYLDPAWVATASPAELTAHAREVLRRRTGATPAQGTTVVVPEQTPASHMRLSTERATTGRR